MQNIVNTIVKTLKNMNGLEAIVLGGSRATGHHSSASDIDIGLYYDKSIDFSLLDKKAQELDQEHREKLLARPGEWGKWQNGGCWLTMDNVAVDLILRDIDDVKTALQESQQGIVTPHYQTGHPHAYFNTMYTGELAICKLLWCQSDTFSKIKAEAENYPLLMKKEIIHLFSFEMSFSFMLAEKNMNRDDIYYVMAHIVRSISAINQVLFALNETYCINEKQAVKLINTFDISPVAYKEKVDSIFYLSFHDTREALKHLKLLLDEVNGFL